MAAPYNNLLTKLETAAANVYSMVSQPLTQFLGIDDSTRSTPNVTFIAEQGEEMPPCTGNFKCTLLVQVITNVDETTDTAHRAAAAAAFDAFLYDDIASLLTAAVADFHVFSSPNGTGLPHRKTERTEARKQISELQFDVYACASDL